MRALFAISLFIAATFASGDLPKLLQLLYPVTNNRVDNVGGGGSPRAPLAPPFAAPN